ncbi:uncharacterized protein LOC111634300 [Centruroides sculpturatus]|uniref:uncharacterized protein LOC111634300 n=1 Tax=Centruroides sculpturatus TaxID=218467 RepID=UPI000C6D8299|nr:uncharacterized protein LOC111634300 [Centruroides sculpturatus]XP_023234806.1 uncharacterized protein LOC111634300 [Centruroides sculpturatus]
MWKGKQVGRRRSIVRRMSSWFPVILPPKIYVKVNVIKNSSDKLEKLSCLNSSLSKLHDGLNIITTLLDNKTADNYVYWRIREHSSFLPSTNHHHQVHPHFEVDVPHL